MKSHIFLALSLVVLASVAGPVEESFRTMPAGATDLVPRHQEPRELAASYSLTTTDKLWNLTDHTKRYAPEPETTRFSPAALVSVTPIGERYIPDNERDSKYCAFINPARCLPQCPPAPRGAILSIHSAPIRIIETEAGISIEVQIIISDSMDEINKE